MPNRYFSEALGDPGLRAAEPGEQTVTLIGPEAHHLKNVMRSAVGDRIELFDGRGTVAEGEILTIRRAESEIRVIDLRSTPAPIGGLTLGVALPKGDRARWLVEKLTELGVITLVPLECERGVTDPKRNRLEKLRATVIEACKQSRRLHLMTITELQPLIEFITDNDDLNTDPVLIAHPDGGPWTSIGRPHPSPLRVAIGPEGGFSPEEIQQADKASTKRLGLGPHILRIETAAIAVAALHGLTGASDRSVAE